MNILITIIQNALTKESAIGYFTDIYRSYMEKYKNSRFSGIYAIIILGVRHDG